MTVVALSGRRIDAPGTTPPRFPAANVDAVRARIRAALERLEANVLVCSAACGADQLALEAAGSLGVTRRVILPFAESRFRDTSVIDRGVEWGAPFDRMMAELRAANAVITLPGVEDATASYAAANLAILDDAQALGRTVKAAVVVMLVAEGDRGVRRRGRAASRKRRRSGGFRAFRFPRGHDRRAGLTARGGSPACRAVLRWLCASSLRERSRRDRPAPWRTAGPRGPSSPRPWSPRASTSPRR